MEVRDLDTYVVPKLIAEMSHEDLFKRALAFGPTTIRLAQELKAALARLDQLKEHINSLESDLDELSLDMKFEIEKDGL